MNFDDLRREEFETKYSGMNNRRLGDIAAERGMSAADLWEEIKLYRISICPDYEPGEWPENIEDWVLWKFKPDPMYSGYRLGPDFRVKDILEKIKSENLSKSKYKIELMTVVEQIQKRRYIAIEKIEKTYSKLKLTLKERDMLFESWDQIINDLKYEVKIIEDRESTDEELTDGSIVRGRCLLLIDLLYKEKYIDDWTYKNKEKTWLCQFSDEKMYNKNYKINWLGTFQEFGYFYEEANKNGVIELEKTSDAGKYFELHFKKDGEDISAIIFKNNCRGCPPYNPPNNKKLEINKIVLVVKFKV